MSIERSENVYALTGNMGCGKSTVAEMLKAYPEIKVLDSDKMAKDIIFDPENAPTIKKILGDEVLVEGSIDKKKVANVIFSDPKKKKDFEYLIHPLVLDQIGQKIQEAGENMIVLVESAIVYETGWDGMFKNIIVATCETGEQFRRIKNRNGWDESEIKRRLSTQMDSKTKEEKSMIVIDTNCSREELKTKTDRLYQYLKNKETGKLVL